MARRKLKRSDDPRPSEPSPLPLVPPALLVPLWLIALALPNLIYSGVAFADTLHIMKWVVTGGPVGIALIIAGARLLIYGRDRFDFGFDLFSVVWLLLLAYCSLQPLWVQISSSASLVQELLCFGAVWAFYVITVASFPNRAVRPLLWLANINAAINVLFAELQIRGLNGFTSLILPTPGNYIGNTAQQNMFGLWMAICVLGSVYLYVAYAVIPSGRKRHPAVTALNLLLMVVNTWGLWNSTSRSGIFSLFAGLFVLGVIVLVRFGREYARRLGSVLLLFLVVLGGAMLVNRDRAGALLSKTVDMMRESHTVGGRIGIWTTSWTMFREHPQGVGVGQYKWHYLKAQREMLKSHDHPWQYTHWAHNEYLQWFCEAGVVGGLLLLLMYCLWMAGFFKALFRRAELSREAIWGCALVALISFNALWTRPFHRIENILWLAVAFAITNREMLPSVFKMRVTFSNAFTRLLGLFLILMAVGGLGLLFEGVRGNLELRQALNTNLADQQRALLEKASTRLFTREDSLKYLGYHYLQVGSQTDDIEAMGRGFNILWQHFQREPHSENMSSLIDWAQRFQQVDILKELASYLKPGTYRLEVQRGARDSAGNEIDALVLVPVRSSGGMHVRSSEPAGAEETVPASKEP
ncbi:MAG: O-antigen ligase family protein [Fretibacterium sp.]|nr:O-antigen ligase family protein [Fretibacterium sp.]